MYNRHNLFVPRTVSAYQAMLNLTAAMSRADYEIAPDGVYVPLNRYLEWVEAAQPKQPGSSWTDAELQQIYRPGTAANERLRRSELMREGN